MKQIFHTNKMSPINSHSTMSSSIIKSLNKRRTMVRLYVALVMLLFASPVMAASGIGSMGKPVFSENKSLVYDRATNPYIGITPDESTKGSTYQVTNENGKTVFSGKIASSKTFYIPTGKLGVGYFSFYINGFMVQQFFVS